MLRPSARAVRAVGGELMLPLAMATGFLVGAAAGIRHSTLLMQRRLRHWYGAG